MSQTRERKVLNLLGQAFMEFAKLKPAHPDDKGEFKHAIHAAQNIVLSRVGSRVLVERVSREVKREK
jgi:hypothetical protein